ncbi:ATP-dependent DNA helicase [Tahibacter harae]|uniref:AAA family ATPase n=1 Tax=Tahibacter harae TaxID=2963937 RepID=A0ABT1QS39_9GAMM|nr:AAA family ATPase [Tahibacter harae]MCQ4165121.1 AAA family ATPase [Tahibacter harae]
MQLTAQQQAAYTAITGFANGAHDALVMTLEGYAGTGKTFLVAAIVRELAARQAIGVAAPTNKAVAVLREKIEAAGEIVGVDFGSIHSFMGLRMKERDDGTHECRPEGENRVRDFSLIVVDECSMLGDELFNRLMQSAAASGTRILFVGDPAQLPPVDGRRANADSSPTFTRVQHKAVLTDVVRQARDNPIIGLSLSIRRAIERGQRMPHMELAEGCPPAPSNACYVGGGRDTLLSWALYDIRDGHDTRILAFRNQAVVDYNHEIHAALHGTATPFAAGEIVMLQESHDARMHGVGADPARAPRQTLFNSEECTVLSIERANHPYYPQIQAWALILERETGAKVVCWYADSQDQLQRQISQLFSEAAQLKGELALQRDAAKDERRRDLIKQAWALKNAFAPLRHIYAMTVHKSQGSTLHTALIDLSDIHRIQDDFSYNRALYVAVTRASDHLALVV